MPDPEVIVDPAKPAESWTSSLSEEFRSLPSISKFKTPDDLAKSYVNLEKLVGLDKLPIPKDEKDEAGWATVFNRLGRPESADKYDVKLNLAEGLSVPEEAINSFKQAAYKAGLSTKQLQSIMGHWADIENTAHSQRSEADKTAVAEAETALRKKLGANFDSARKNVEAFVNLHATSPEAKARILERIKRDPEEFEALFNASKSFSEEALKVGKPAGLGPVEAKKEYDRILADLKGPYYDPMHPEHKATKQKMMDLLAMSEAGQ